WLEAQIRRAAKCRVRNGHHCESQILAIQDRARSSASVDAFRLLPEQGSRRDATLQQPAGGGAPRGIRDKRKCPGCRIEKSERGFLRWNLHALARHARPQ